jgi:hypothetical protein
VLKSYFASIFSKGKDPEPDPFLFINGSGSGTWRPKNLRILQIRSGSQTLGVNQSFKPKITSGKVVDEAERSNADTCR